MIKYTQNKKSMYIFFGVKMEYIIYVCIAAIIICGIILGCITSAISKTRREYKALKQIKEQLEVQTNLMQNDLAEQHKLLTKLTEDIVKAGQELLVTKQRAAEASEATEQVLVSEQKRLAAELQRKKELGEIKLEQELKQKEEALNLLYIKQNQELENDYQHNQVELIALKEQLADFRKIQDSINEATRRQKELEEKEDFYSLQISEADKEDIATLQNMDLKLHNRNVIPKLIWDLFLRRPAQEMIKRVTGSRDISGIYKITNKKTKEAYIGKTTDISTRWQNHLKTAVGLDAAAKSTLHTRLAADGLWNYTFEILEEVPKDQLAARETFYINLYGTKQQLNMKDGNKNGTQ